MCYFGVVIVLLEVYELYGFDFNVINCDGVVDLICDGVFLDL